MHKPNLVFIFTDQQNFRISGAYGNDLVRTPKELSEEAWLLDETEAFLQTAPTDRPFFL